MKLSSLFTRKPAPTPAIVYGRQPLGVAPSLSIRTASGRLIPRYQTRDSHGRIIRDSRGRIGRPVVDAGMVTSFRPAQHTKPNQQSFMNKLTQRFIKASGWLPGEETMEQGSSGAASPSTYALTLYQQRYDRRSYITECRNLFIEDPRVNRACWEYGKEAVRGGPKISVLGSDDKSMRGSLGNRIRVAAQAAIEVQDSLKDVLVSWATMQIVEGDLATQAIISEHADKWAGAKRMPAVSMERNTDDQDNFIDEDRAFSQVDISTNEEVATFAMGIICWSRWNYIDGERYGTPHLMPVRRRARLMDLMEEAQAVRRMVRANCPILFNIKGSTDVPGTEDQINTFIEQNGFQDGVREIFDPTNVSGNIFANGFTDAKPISTDAHVSDIADLEYMSEILFIGLPTPGPLCGFGLKGINPDVLTIVQDMWLKSTVMLTDCIAKQVKFHFEANLLCRGIDPRTIKYNIFFPESTTETMSEQVDRLLKLRRNTMGVGLGAVPDPMITRKTFLASIANIYAIGDIAAYEAEIDAEVKEMLKLGMQQGAGMMANSQGTTKSGTNQSASRTLTKTQTGSPHQAANSGNVANKKGLAGSPSVPNTKPGDAKLPWNGVGAFPDMPIAEDPSFPVPANPNLQQEQEHYGVGTPILPWDTEFGSPQDITGGGFEACDDVDSNELNERLWRLEQMLGIVLQQNAEHVSSSRNGASNGTGRNGHH